MSAAPTRRVILTDGTEVVLDGPRTMTQIRERIGAQTLDTAILRHLGRPLQVMLIDDQGHEKQLPVNQKATALYHANCLPGTTHTIRGDVVITLDDDFASASHG